jgi:hypothetical protein
VGSVIRRYWKPALLLMVLSPLLAEVISGATPMTLFFMPWIFFPYATILYGFPVLVIREVAVRGKLGLLGLWCLGLIYGLYNEGLRAQTLFYPLDAPLDTFSTYGLVADIRVPFTLWISFWHGLFSVVTPILFVEYLFPKKADEPWLPLKATWSLAILSVGTAVPYFLFVGDASSTQDVTTLMVHITFLVVAALVLWFVAGRLPRIPSHHPQRCRQRLQLEAVLLGGGALPVLVCRAGGHGPGQSPLAALRSLFRRARDTGWVGDSPPTGNDPRAGGGVPARQRHGASCPCCRLWRAHRQHHVGGIGCNLHGHFRRRSGAHQAETDGDPGWSGRDARAVC